MLNRPSSSTVPTLQKRIHSPSGDHRGSTASRREDLLGLAGRAMSTITRLPAVGRRRAGRCIPRWSTPAGDRRGDQSAVQNPSMSRRASLLPARRPPSRRSHPSHRPSPLRNAIRSPSRENRGDCSSPVMSGVRSMGRLPPRLGAGRCCRPRVSPDRITKVMNSPLGESAGSPSTPGVGGQAVEGPDLFGHRASMDATFSEAAFSRGHGFGGGLCGPRAIAVSFSASAPLRR